MNSKSTKNTVTTGTGAGCLTEIEANQAIQHALTRVEVERAKQTMIAISGDWAGLQKSYLRTKRVLCWLDYLGLSLPDQDGGAGAVDPDKLARSADRRAARIMADIEAREESTARGAANLAAREEKRVIDPTISASNEIARLRRVKNYLAARKSAAAHDAGEVPKAGAARASLSPWDGADLLARGIYRRAARLAEGIARRFMARNQRACIAQRWKGRSATAEHTGNNGDEIGAGVLIEEEMRAACREIAFAIVPLLLARLKKRRAGAGAAIVAARRLLYTKTAKKGGICHGILYGLTGRGSKDWGWDTQTIEEILHRHGSADWVGGAQLDKPLSSDVRTVKSGGAGRRPSVGNVTAAAIASGMIAAAKFAAKSGKGSAKSHERAAEVGFIVSILHDIETGETLDGELCAEIFTGAENGISSKWLEKLRKFRRDCEIEKI